MEKRDIQYSKYECVINGDLHNGIILEVCEDGLMVRPFYVNDDYQYVDGEQVRYEPYWLPKDEFDEVELKIWDDLWGCDNSAIGLDGCFEPWGFIWSDDLKWSYY